MKTDFDIGDIVRFNTGDNYLIPTRTEIFSRNINTQLQMIDKR
jgi:hypothetical protein